MRSPDRPERHGLARPTLTMRLGGYLPAFRPGDPLFTAGQLSLDRGQLTTGRIGDAVCLDEEARSASQCTTTSSRSRVAHLSATQTVNATTYVASAPGILSHSCGGDDASEPFGEVKGRSRTPCETRGPCTAAPRCSGRARPRREAAASVSQTVPGQS